MAFFFRFQNNVIKKYTSIFPERPKGTSIEDELEKKDRKSIAEHYGWLYTFKELADTSVLQITGDKRITDLNIIFAFNYLSMLTEISLEKQQKQKQIKPK